MKKLSFLCGVVLLLAMATGAFAFPGAGDGFPTFGQFGGAALFGTDFAPSSVTVIDLGTKGGYTNIAVDKLTKYQISIVKLSDNTAVACSAKFGGYSSVYGTSATGKFPTSGVGPWHPGLNTKRIAVYGCASTSYAARPQVVIYKQ
jgi:hypothetical protein